MLYLSILIIVLIGYIIFVQLRLNKTKKTLKKIIKENEHKNISEEQVSEDICFRIDTNFIISYVNGATCKILGFKKEELIGRHILGTLIESNDANKATLESDFNKIIKEQSTVHNEQIIIDKKGNRKLINLRQRPILNEVLKCIGVSYLCTDDSERIVLQQKIKDLDHKDKLTNILNEEAFLNRLEHNFKLAKRYNKEFSLDVIELADVYDFINKGISFESGDKLLKSVAEVCSEEQNVEIGRFDKTKIGIILNDKTREQALKIAQNLNKKIIKKVQTLGVDEYNAQMIVISYTNRKSINDTYDVMLERLRRHIKNALRRREYGINSSDVRGKQLG